MRWRYNVGLARLHIHIHTWVQEHQQGTKACLRVCLGRGRGGGAMHAFMMVTWGATRHECPTQVTVLSACSNGPAMHQ